MSDWWKGAVIYQIYPRSFQDSNGDGIGDIPGITARLEYVADLGVDAVWLSPVFLSPMADMGYDVSGYTEIDPLFGTLDDFDRLVERAHELGIRIIIDQVISHSSDQHPWFKESRTDKQNRRADWYVWSDPGPDGMPPNNWVSVFGGPAWEWDATRRQYYFHNFLKEQPDLNFHNPDVQDELLASMDFWLRRGVDGFRLDTVNYYFHDQKFRSNPPAEREDVEPAVNPYDMQDHCYAKNRPENLAFLSRIRMLLNKYDDRTLIGEVGETPQRAMQIMADYTRGQDRLHMAYSFDMLSPKFTAAHFRTCIEGFFRSAEDGWPCWSFSNHDVERHASRWLEYSVDPGALVRQAAALLLSFRGSVCLYQGEELGLTEASMAFEELTDPPGIRFWPEYKGRDGCRTPIPWNADKDFSEFSSVPPWLPVKPEQAKMHVAGQLTQDDSNLAFYRGFLRFRAAHPAMRRGELDFIEVPEPMLAFRRGPKNEGLIFIFNLSSGNVSCKMEGLSEFPGAPQQSVSVNGNIVKLGPNGFGCFVSKNNRDE